jgi:hypothetical protein
VGQVLAEVQEITEWLVQHRFDRHCDVAGFQSDVRDVPLRLFVGAHQPAEQLLAGGNGTAQRVIGEGTVRVGEQSLIHVRPRGEWRCHGLVQLVQLVEHWPSGFSAPASRECPAHWFVYSRNYALTGYFGT